MMQRFSCMNIYLRTDLDTTKIVIISVFRLHNFSVTLEDPLLDAELLPEEPNDDSVNNIFDPPTPGGFIARYEYITRVIS